MKTTSTTNTLFEGLNKQQEAAVKHQDGPLLIVAGAGTGKTTVITRRIAHLVAIGAAKADEIAALTFTEKAANEMCERVDLLMPFGAYNNWICTFHGFCEQILKAHALDIGLPNDFTLLDSTRQWIFLYKNIEKFDLKYYRPLGNPSKFIDAMLSHFSRCKDEVITPETYLNYAQSLRLQFDHPEKIAKKKSKKSVTNSEQLLAQEPIDETEIARLEELAGAYHTYQRLMIQNNFLDFGDLIHYTVKLFKERPKILAYYQKKFKYVMVDEFQDTNYAQYELVKMLSESHQNLVVVGDDDQSIYKFRGASVSNILKLQTDYPRLEQITLIENYRSTQKILDLAYNFIQQNNPERLEVKFNIDKRLKSNLEIEGVVEVIEGGDLASELNTVVQKMQALKNSEGESWNEFAVLLRRNASSSELLPVLASNGIPYTFVANKGLYKKQIIVDILSYLKLLDNFHDSASLYRVLSLPKFHIPHNEVSTLLLEAKKKAWSLFELFEQIPLLSSIAPESKKKIQTLVSLLKTHSQETKQLHAAEIFVQIVKDLGIEEKIKDDTLENAENRELIEQLFKKIEQFGQEETDRSLHNFLYTLDLELEAGNEGEIKFDPNIGPETVKVMTVHSAKGLEFKYVFVISMVDQRFPTREKNEPIEIPEALVKDILPEGDFHLQEERRLFYVAITRAKTHLYLSWAKDYGGSRTKKPSIFLSETGLVPSESVSKATGKVVFTRPAKETVVFSISPTQFSYSQLNDFENCPLKYKYQHYLKLPVEGSCYLSFGQTIHKVFEEYLKLYKNNLSLPKQDLFGTVDPTALPDFKFLEQFYEKVWVDDWYADKKEKEEFRARGKNMLKTFYDGLVQEPFKPKYIEQFFKLPVGNFTFTGKIDRADEIDGGISILDYKTGKIPKAADKKDLDQLYIYQWASEYFLREEVKQMRYWYIQDNKFIEEPIATHKEIDKLRDKLLATMEKIVHTTKYDLFAEEHKRTRDHNCEFEILEK